MFVFVHVHLYLCNTRIHVSLLLLLIIIMIYLNNYVRPRVGCGCVALAVLCPYSSSCLMTVVTTSQARLVSLDVAIVMGSALVVRVAYVRRRSGLAPIAT